MQADYRVADTSEIITPALVIFRAVLEENIDKMLRIAGDSTRLRPHCKTHKMREVIKLQLARGITKHKCATFAEAEMLAEVGVTDIVLAYPLVGINIRRAVSFVAKYPDVMFAAIADHTRPIAQLSEAMSDSGQTMQLLIDIDTGQHRTGVPPGERAKGLYRQIIEAGGLEAGGFHIYDGHQHQESREERAAAILESWENVVTFRDQVLRDDGPVPRLVCGGTASFPVYAELKDPTIEVSPGTCVFWDEGYRRHFPDLDFSPAALLLTRVISTPAADRLTLDLGYKAVASDPPAGARLRFPDLSDAEALLQNEEHLVLQTNQADQFQPGDELWAIPTHICPTSALHRQVNVIGDGQLIDRWDVTARDRWMTI